MSKALEILKDVVEQSIGEGIFAPMTEVEVQNFFFEAIAELKAMEARIKELETPKTCEGCEQCSADCSVKDALNAYGQFLDYPSDICCKSRYEPKDNG